MIWTASPAKGVPILVSPRLYHLGVHCLEDSEYTGSALELQSCPQTQRTATVQLIKAQQVPVSTMFTLHLHIGQGHLLSKGMVNHSPSGVNSSPSSSLASRQNLTTLHEASPCCQTPNVQMDLKGSFLSAFNCSLLIAHTYKKTDST